MRLEQTVRNHIEKTPPPARGDREMVADPFRPGHEVESWAAEIDPRLRFDAAIKRAMSVEGDGKS